LVAPIVFGIVCVGERFRIPAIFALVIAAFTHSVYPYLYPYVLATYPPMVAVLSIRNLLEVALWVFSVVHVWKSGPKIRC
jgi:hypothetical protein